MNLAERVANRSMRPNIKSIRYELVDAYVNYVLGLAEQAGTQPDSLIELTFISLLDGVTEFTENVVHGAFLKSALRSAIMHLWLREGYAAVKTITVRYPNGACHSTMHGDGYALYLSNQQKKES